MNSKTKSEQLTGDELSLDESRELAAEVCRATEGDSQSDLHQFAALLCQVIDLQIGSSAESGSADATEAFITESLDEIRSIFEADGSGSEKMDALRNQAVEQWGDQIQAIDFEGDAIDVWQDGQSFDEESAIEETDHEADQSEDVSAPSAELIQSLMSQLTQSSPEAGEIAPAAIPTPPATSQSPAPSNVKPSNASAAPAPTGTGTDAIDSLDPELREAFLDDATGCLASMEDAMLRLDSDSNDRDSLNQILRELHTLKGASGSVGLTSLADQIHQLEDRLRDDEQAGRSPSINDLFRELDSIRSQVTGEPAGEVADTQSQPSRPSNAANEQPETVSQKPAASAAPAPTPTFSEAADDESVRVKSSQLNRLMDMLAELVMLRNRRETELSELQDVHRELIGSVSKMRQLSNEGQVESAASTSLQLSEVANDVLEAAHHLRDCARPVAEGNQAVSQFIRQFRQELVELRRTPVSGLFRRLQRVVRDAAQAESKEVRLQLVGEDAGIERSLQQRLYEPLLHIVRNSVCHGIETPDQRGANGKKTTGTITLEATSRAEMFVIEIRDDGRGLDYDAIRRRGIDKGLLAADQVASREELSQLIFHPGFSTRESANQVAGRGVGMDVVASTLQRMRGWLEVDSEPNQGTRIRLSFPMPSVIQHAMVFRSAGQLFALPMQSVQTAGEVKQRSMCLCFSDLLGGERSGIEAGQRIVLAHETAKSRNVDGQLVPVTLKVDEIVGPEEVVVRPLPSLLKQHPFCSGATLSGMGQTVLLLDARRVVETQGHHLQDHDPEADKNDSTPIGQPRVLVVDDSLSARKRVVRSLRRFPVDIVEASDGKEALELLKKDHFSAVFSDMEMPHVTGMELLAEVNGAGAVDPPPVVIISSRSEDEFTSRARKLGAANYLFKPLADESLDEAISGIESLRHLLANSQEILQRSGENQ